MKMTYTQAYAALPTDAEWSCSFGYPGKGGFVDVFRTPAGQRWEITNGAWWDGNDWKCQPVGVAGDVLQGAAFVPCGEFEYLFGRVFTNFTFTAMDHLRGGELIGVWAGPAFWLGSWMWSPHLIGYNTAIMGNDLLGIDGDTFGDAVFPDIAWCSILFDPGALSDFEWSGWWAQADRRLLGYITWPETLVDALR